MRDHVTICGKAGRRVTGRYACQTTHAFAHTHTHMSSWRHDKSTTSLLGHTMSHKQQAKQTRHTEPMYWHKFACTTII